MTRPALSIDTPNASLASSKKQSRFIMGSVGLITLIFVGVILFIYGKPTTYEALGGMATAVMALGGLISLFVLAASWLDQSLHQRTVLAHQEELSVLSFQKIIYDLHREWLEDEHRKLDSQWKNIFHNKDEKRTPCFKAMMKSKERLMNMIESYAKIHNLNIEFAKKNGTQEGEPSGPPLSTTPK